MAINKALFLEEFYEKTILQLRQLRSKKQEEWQAVIEETKAKIEKTKQKVISIVEKCFQEIEEKILYQFLGPSQETAMERVHLPIKVLVTRKCKRK